MRKCPDCSSLNFDADEFCKRCGSRLPTSQQATPTVASGPGSRPVSRASDTSDDPIVRSLEREIQSLRRQFLSHTSGLAGALSAVLPGLGQIYAGSLGSGIPIMLAWLVGVPTYVTWVSRSLVQPAYRWLPRPEFTTTHALVGLVIVVLWIANIFHAISVSQALQGGK